MSNECKSPAELEEKIRSRLEDALSGRKIHKGNKQVITDIINYVIHQAEKDGLFPELCAPELDVKIDEYGIHITTNGGSLVTDKRMVKVICDQLGIKPEQVLDIARLNEDLGADSLEIVELCIAMEEEYDLVLDDEQWDGIKTVADIVRVIEAAL